MTRTKFEHLPDYQQNLHDFLLEGGLPEDVTFIVIVQREGEEQPLLMTNCDEMRDVAKTFRDMAKSISGDA